MADVQNDRLMDTTSKAAVALGLEIKRRGWTHEDAETALGMATNSGQITRFLSGSRRPGRRVAYQIERVLGVPMSWWEVPSSRRAA